MRNHLNMIPSTRRPRPRTQTLDPRNQSARGVEPLGEAVVDLPRFEPLAAESPAAVETARGLDAYHQYLSNIRRLPLLRPDRETELACRARAGDAAAREELIQSNLRLVVKFARDYENANLPLLDLIGEGNIGLMKAVDRFDPARGVKLSVYASFWIKQAIRRALGNHSRTVRLPIHVHSHLTEIERIARRLHQLLERVPTEAELARAAGLTPGRLAVLRRSALPAASLDAPIGEESEGSLGECLRDERMTTPAEQLAEEDQRELLRECLGKLAPREATVLRWRFGVGDEQEHTLEHVAERLGVSRERIRQIQKAALKKLGRLMVMSPASRARWNARCRRRGAGRRGVA